MWVVAGKCGQIRKMHKKIVVIQRVKGDIRNYMTLGIKGTS